MKDFEQPARTVPVREVDVVVAGGGTAGVVAALAAAQQGANTALVEWKGYTGGLVTEGGTALHSFFNLWKAFPGVEKRQVVKGIPQEIIGRLEKVGGTSGHAEMLQGYDYDSVCTAVDTELYKLVTLTMLEEAGVELMLNTVLADAIVESGTVKGVLTESHAGREAIFAKAFVDSTGYGDLCARAGADFTEPNDQAVANSMGVANVSVEGYHELMAANDAVKDYCEGTRSGEPGKIVRLDSRGGNMPEAYREAKDGLGMADVITTVQDDYFMFVKINTKMPVSPTDRDAVASTEVQLRRQQANAIRVLRQFVPGCEKAFMARTSPSLCIRRGRSIACDYDITIEDIVEGRHFEDDVMAYGFHDRAPKFKVKDGGTYGVPYRALRVAGFDNLLAAGMLITSDYDAHMSTRNTVCCMGQGQGAGTAAALCADKGCRTRDLPYADLRSALEAGGVHFE